jgi:16S rRNA (uracil1498-N3)-methyltransferase
MILTGDEARHLTKVLRAEPGQEVEVTDGQGRVAETEIVRLDRDEAELVVRQQIRVPEPSVRLGLVQALPREQKLDYVIQKATELGVRDLYPVEADRSVARVRPGKEEAKQDRWTRIAINAIKQCRSPWLPEVHPVAGLDAILDSLAGETLLIACSLEPDAMPLPALLDALPEPLPTSIACLVGPEGDWTARELAALRNAGARRVSLGSLVLRSETASLYCLSVLHYSLILRSDVGRP